MFEKANWHWIDERPFPNRIACFRHRFSSNGGIKRFEKTFVFLKKGLDKQKKV